METAKTRLFEIRFRKIIVSKEKGAQKVVKKGGERGARLLNMTASTFCPHWIVPQGIQSFGDGICEASSH